MGMEFLSWVVFIGLIWFIVRFYWARVAVGGIMLVVWGGMVVAVPIYFVSVRLHAGEYAIAAVTLLISLIPAAAWGSAVYFMACWYRRQTLACGGFWKPWNSK